MDICKQTRKDAFEANTEYKVKVRDKILATMIQHSDRRWTASGLSKFLGIKLGTVRPRVCDLKAEGKIEAVGITHKYGIREAVYKIVEEDKYA